LGIPRASGMRKDELDRAARDFLRTGKIPKSALKVLVLELVEGLALERL